MSTNHDRFLLFFRYLLHLHLHLPDFRHSHLIYYASPRRRLNAMQFLPVPPPIKAIEVYLWIVIWRPRQ